MWDRYPINVQMGVKSSLVDLLTMCKIKDTDAAVHINIAQCNLPQLAQIRLQTSRANDNHAQVLYWQMRHKKGHTPKTETFSLFTHPPLLPNQFLSSVVYKIRCFKECWKWIAINLHLFLFYLLRMSMVMAFNSL